MRFLIFPCLLLLFEGAYMKLQAQEDTLQIDTTLANQKDITDVLRSIFNKPLKQEAEHKASVTFLPILGYNPSFGFNIGVNMMAGKQFGLKSNTIYSVFNISFSYSTKQVIPLRARHNMYTPGNKWNWQGDWQISKMGVVDFGVGTGQTYKIKEAFSFFDLPVKNFDSSFPIKYNYLKLFEKAYRKVGKYWYVGLGVAFDIYGDIKDEKLAEVRLTPHKRYSIRNDFDTVGYSANGFLFALQYNSRDHPIRSYRGIYADVNLRFNQTWMGSSKNAILLIYDFREYVSLSRVNPEHSLAFWQWASFKLDGSIPYLVMPGTGQDTYNRSGRAYTFGRFKGPSYACFEAEYRFPIMKNKLISGVGFFNLQTASNDQSKKVFEYWEPGGGAGLRILFNKKSRSALCIDFARGRNGASGLFLGLNEVF
jgi:outer membrane protein assembly factor BamA